MDANASVRAGEEGQPGQGCGAENVLGGLKHPSFGSMNWQELLNGFGPGEDDQGPRIEASFRNGWFVFSFVFKRHLGCKNTGFRTYVVI